MFESNRDRLAVLVLAALLLAEQLSGERDPPTLPEAQLTRVVAAAHLHVHALAGRAYGWLGSLLDGVSCQGSLNAGAPVLTCGVE